MALKKDFINDRKNKIQKLTYRDYRKILFENSVNDPLAILKESTFNSFFNSVSGEIKIVSVENEGYALYEETKEKLTIFELFGNEKLLLNAVFENTEKESLVYRQIAKENSIPYGMYYKINDVPEIKNGFFGIPYSN